MDSLKIAPGGLKELCESYKLKNQKKDSVVIKDIKSYKDFMENYEVIVKYFIKDCLSLCELITIIRNEFINEYKIDIL